MAYLDDSYQETKSRLEAAASKAAANTQKKKSSGMFGPKKIKKTYEGEPGGKAEWFLSDALDTVYDPHGTGKAVKPATILARSAQGNVRVRDVVHCSCTSSPWLSLHSHDASGGTPQQI